MSVILGNKIYMIMYYKEWCCNCELKGNAWDFKEGLFITQCTVCIAIFVRVD